MEQIRKFYHFDMPVQANPEETGEESTLTTVLSEDLFTPKKFMALTEGAEQIAVEKPNIERSQRGLRALSLRVRDLVYEK